MPTLVHSLVAAATLCFVASGYAIDAPTLARTARPELTLPEVGTAGAAGQRAIDALGAHLDAVASSYGKTAATLREILLTDPTARIDAQGHLFYLEEGLALLPPIATASDAARHVEAPAALGKTFKLHSLPSAKRTIYLDFNGAVLSNTAWNHGSDITALPYDVDGDLDHFSDTELQRIQGIWQRIAEDYAPFAIDVTTEQPAQERLSRADESDDEFGTTALITNHNGVYNCQCGGVAYLGVFDSTSDFNKPALIFYDMLAKGDEKDVAEAASHETGHNLGLNHDGTSTQGYYAGHGSGPTGWAPIMGVGYYQPLVQWSKGEYADANNHEDDFLVMQNNGGPLRADDHGNNAGHATPLKAKIADSTVKLSGSGVIERREDKDAFSFSANAGDARFTLLPDPRSGNLDIRARLLDASGTVIASASPKGVIDASLNATLPAAGTYTLIIDGVGTGDVLGDGYSDYGSLGQYTISGTAVAL